MAAHGVFNVTFGINETLLSQALDEERYEQAEGMVIENSHSTYLDEGCYQRTPFYIVLCGKNTQDEPAPRHLYIAKLLTENGADVNYRVPAMSMGAEYVDPGQSAVELITDLFNELTAHLKTNRNVIPFSALEVYGLDGHMLTDVESCLDQLLNLISIIMAHGGDLYVRDWYGMTPLHRTVLYSRDIRLTKLLTDWGADLNTQDVFGNTPIGALCEAFPRGLSHCIDELDEDGYGEQDYAESEWLIILSRQACYQSGKMHFLTTLLDKKSLKLDIQNKCGCTALFNAVMRGDSKSSYQLLRHGADPTLRAQVLSLCPKETREISPLFSSMLSIRLWTDKLSDRSLPAHPQFLAHLVDQDFFSQTEIITELHSYIDNYFPVFAHLKIFGPDLLNLLFGQLSASLRQLAVREVFNNHLEENPDSINDESSPQFACILVQRFNLPQSCVLHFEVELLRRALFYKFSQFHRMNYKLDGADDSDYSSGQNDSDIDYW